MPRRKLVKRREVTPDAKFGSPLVTKFVNCLMIQGKKSTAERVFYNCMDLIEKRTGQPGIQVFKQAINNVKPVPTVRTDVYGKPYETIRIEIRPIVGAVLSMVKEIPAVNAPVMTLR